MYIYACMRTITTLLCEEGKGVWGSKKALANRMLCKLFNFPWSLSSKSDELCIHVCLFLFFMFYHRPLCWCFHKIVESWRTSMHNFCHCHNLLRRFCSDFFCFYWIWMSFRGEFWYVILSKNCEKSKQICNVWLFIDLNSFIM